MSQNLRQTITELEARAKQYEVAATTARQVAQQLRDLLQLDAPTAKSVKPATPPTAKKPAAKGNAKPKATPAKKTKSKVATQSTGKPTLASAIAHVLETRRSAKSGGVKASQLYDEIHDAGYRFNGTNKKNNMTYLYKILRQNKTRFAHANDGTFSLKG